MWLRGLQRSKKQSANSSRVAQKLHRARPMHIINKYKQFFRPSTRIDPSIDFDQFSRLPIDLVCVQFRYFDRRELLILKQVCKRFFAVVSSQFAVKPFLQLDLTLSLWSCFPFFIVCNNSLSFSAVTPILDFWKHSLSAAMVAKRSCPRMCSPIYYHLFDFTPFECFMVNAVNQLRNNGMCSDIVFE